MSMIDLGTLSASIVVEGQEGISNLREFRSEAEQAESVSLNLKEGLIKLAKGFAIGATIKKTTEAIVGCVKKADELKQSYNTLQTQTGATDEEMKGLEQSLKNIYSNNYGESFEDIAQAMAEVKTQTGLTGEKLEKTTQNAIALRDTFGFEAQESVRATDMMMKQFGLTSEQAFNLIAQGSQAGLDKNGNLLDSINEYSVHFNQLGFSAEEMFNMFANGAEAGVFDIDKLGDAVKEFGIRAKDGSDTTVAAFENLGLNADELQVKFAEGGESANEAFVEVAETLQNCDDEVVKNTAGVNLFGTMWEDMGETAINALTNTNGEFDKTKSTMEEINNIKYDSLGSAFEGISRQIETGVVISIGEKLLPKLNEFANWINENMPQIQQIADSVLNGIGNAVTFVANNLNILIPILAGTLAGFVAFQIISTISTLFTTFKTVITGVTTAQGLLNAVMAANPFGAVATVIGLLVAAGVALYMNWDTIKQKAQELFAKLSEVWNNIKTTVVNKVEEIKAGIINKFTSIKDEMLNIGRNIVEGLWNGITSAKDWLFDKVGGFVGGIVDKAKGILDIHSPSRVMRDEVGVMITRGIGEGIEKGKNYALKAIDKISNTIITGIEKLNGKIEKIEEDAQKRQAEKQLADRKKQIDDLYKNLEKAEEEQKEGILQQIYQLEEQWNEERIKEQEEAEKELLKKQIETLENFKNEYETTIDDIKKEYEDAVDDIIDKQEKMSENLSDFDLFSTKEDEEGNVEYQIENLEDYISKLDKYSRVMEELQNKNISEDLMAEIVNMDIDDAIGYGNKLLRMSDESFENYVSLWDEKQKKSKEIAEKFYEDELETLSKDFDDKLDNELSTIKETTYNLGTDSVQAIIDGMEEKEPDLYSKANSIANAIKNIIDSAFGSSDSNENIDGSHRTGLREVPFDGYNAILHKGEMVLTQPEADRYRNNSTEGKNTNIVQNFYGVKENRTAFAVYRQTQKSLKQLGLA